MLEEFQPEARLPVSLSSERIKIRRWQVADMKEHERLYVENIEHLAPWMPPQVAPRSMNERRQFARDKIYLALDRWEDGTDFRFYITRKSDNVIMGQIGVTGVIRNVNQSGFIGYWMGKEFTGQGYATEATVLAMQFAFDYLNLHRVSLWISPDNYPSLRIAEKLELRHEGLIQGALFLGGRWQDTEIYAITTPEWVLRRQELIERFLD